MSMPTLKRSQEKKYSAMHSLWDKQLVWGSVISQALSIRVCVCVFVCYYQMFTFCCNPCKIPGKPASIARTA